MQLLEVSGAVRPLYVSLGVKGLSHLYCHGCMERGAMLSRLYEIWQQCYQILVGSSDCDYSVEKMKYY